MYRVIEKLRAQDTERWLLKDGCFAPRGSVHTIATFETQFDAQQAAARAPNARPRAVLIVQRQQPNGDWKWVRAS